jgi:hypothetical protein
MKIAIMQPYLFPYIGYFQLIRHADLFVVYDDVQYIKGGWINRNRILYRGKDRLFTFGVEKGSTYANINQRWFSNKLIEDKHKLKVFLKESYENAPHYKEISSLVDDLLNFPNDNIARNIVYVLERLCSYLRITTPFILSSSLTKDSNLKKEAKVIRIVKLLGGSQYINPIGGISLYSKEQFQAEGIELFFLKTGPIRYTQFEKQFIPNLSILDVLMFNSITEIQSMLTEYELI